jgi:plastocyanin
MNGLNISMLIAFLSGSAVALAAETSVRQKGRLFTPNEVTVKKGEILLFVNDDNITHNVYSASTGNQFNLGAVAPGNSTPVTFKNAGSVDIFCAIHPSMKMSLKVTD